MSSSALDDATLDRLRAVFEAAGGDGPVVLTDAAGRAIFTLAGPPASGTNEGRDGDAHADTGGDYLLRLAEHLESLPEDPYAEFRDGGETTAELLRRAAAEPGVVTTGAAILEEAARRERENADGGAGA